MKLTGALLVAALVGAAIAIAAVDFARGSSEQRFYVENPTVIQRWAIQPATMDFSVDGSFGAIALRWRRWGKATAIASGYFEFHDCQYPCRAQIVVPGTVSLRGVVGCRGSRYYTEIIVRAPGGLWNPDQPEQLYTPCNS